MRIAIIGAGAAGCFAAANIMRMLPSAEVTVFESGTKPLAKVAVTGGGRCNLTNSFRGVKSVESVYPRGHRLMKRLLKEFSHEDAYRWFEEAGVRLLTQDDECVFPVSQDAMQIVNTLLSMMRSQGVTVFTNHRATSIAVADGGGYDIMFTNGRGHHADCVVVTTGGSPRLSGLSMLSPLGLDIVPPIPSLFSLSLGNDTITRLTGTVVEDVSVSIPGTRMKASGPLLITHWGLSGPSVLKLSSYAARWLADHDYRASISINWFGDANEVAVASLLSEMSAVNPQKQLHSVFPRRFNSRLWLFLLDRCSMRPDMRWAEIGSKALKRMSAMLTNDIHEVCGRSRTKDEFVTCGGIALSNVNPSTLECRRHPGLYFAGEVLDVDAVTGGFNLQAAWTMGYVVAKSISQVESSPVLRRLWPTQE